jgi:para-aminobenzoate synthetase/4-amino-4-deoxychorismate lyase
MKPASARLVRRVLPWDLEPEDALRLMRADAHPVALLGAWAGGSDLIASEPTKVRCETDSLQDVFDAPWPGGAVSAQRGAEGLGFGGGWIGYLGFGLTEQLLPAPPAPGGARALPTWWFGYYDHVLRRDRTSGQWAFEALWTPERADALERRFDDLSQRYERADQEPRPYLCGDFIASPSADEHRGAVRRAIEYVRQGDILQANVCLRLEAEFSGDPLDAFCRATAALRPPYAAFLRLPEGAVASLSPELFLRRTGTTVLTRPIKGTRRRPAAQPDAARQRDLLLGSDKDRAENVMIVDLMRNDLSRVCVPGSVIVPRMLSAEAHPGVWHLVSDVQGTIPADTSDRDLIAATFPPGSVTGAPKVRATEIIHGLEATPREVYTGAVGYRSPVAGLELNVAIRTFEFHDDHVWLGSGGAITARSDADDEYRECLLKATPLITSLGARVDTSRPTPVASGRTGQAPNPPSMRLRPAAGVFTSLRVTDGRAQDLDEHLARLQDSTKRLYGKRLPAALWTAVAASLDGNPSGRLRITAQPVGGPLKVCAEVVPVNPQPSIVTLRGITVPGGLGRHKWLDRRLLVELAKTFGPGEQILIQDRTGEILETDRANVFAMVGGVLHTPPADGRILPGVTRAAVLRLADTAGIATEQLPLTARQLAQASEIFVTNSVRGITPARLLADGTAILPAGPVTARIAALLAGRSATPLPPAIRTPVPRLDCETGARGRGIGSEPVVVLIDNYDSFPYNLAHLLRVNHCQVEIIRNDEVSAQAIAALHPAGIVISPGPCTPEEAGVSVETVRVCGPATPILGVCLGHQAIAAAYGGRIIRAPRPVHGQASAITHDGRGVLRELPQRFLAARYHSLLVDADALPGCLSLTARTSSGLPMGLRHTRYPTEGIQFHPESILTPHGAAIVHTFTQTIRYRIPEPAKRAEPAGVR